MTTYKKGEHINIVLGKQETFENQAYTVLKDFSVEHVSKSYQGICPYRFKHILLDEGYIGYAEFSTVCLGESALEIKHVNPITTTI